MTTTKKVTTKVTSEKTIKKTVTPREWRSATMEQRSQWLQEGIRASDPTTEQKPISERAIKAAATRKANKEKNEQMAQIMEALRIEYSLFRQALENGIEVILPTAFGPYIVDGISPDHQYSSHPQGSTTNDYNHRTFYGCNDGAWADLLRQAGVERHPLFAKWA